MSEDGNVAVPIPDGVIDAIAQRAAQIVVDCQQEQRAARWLYGAKAAAAYLGWPVKRVTNKVATGALPHHRSGGRLMFDTAELDRVVREGV
jgi:hypothetical protein